MAVDKHPSRRPSPPRKPPATSTTDGQPNTVGKTMTGDGWMEYGSRNGKHLNLKITHDHGSERHSDFMSFSEGKAPRAGKEQADEPKSRKVSKAGRPGDEKSDDSPG
jgi:hypothetical protein